MSIDKRAIWHESGHSVVALSVGFSAADIVHRYGNLECTHIPAQCSEVSLHKRYIVLASGAASEKLQFGDYGPGGSSADAARILELGGTTIDDYLPEAVEILAAHKRELEMMAEQLGEKWDKSIYTGRPNPFVVMPAAEVDAVHNAANSTGGARPSQAQSF